jgi:hypothetical protein
MAMEVHAPFKENDEQNNIAMFTKSLSLHCIPSATFNKRKILTFTLDINLIIPKFDEG